MKKILALLLFLSATLCFAQTRPAFTELTTFDNLVSLRAAKPSLTASYTAIIEGYATRNDGGGGRFVWQGDSTLADNGGTVITPTGYVGAGRWIRDCPKDVINVRHFGAVGDAVVAEVAYSAATHSGGNVSSYTGLIHEFSGTDDTTAFQRAAAALDSGKTFYIPAGKYLVNGNASGWDTSTVVGCRSMTIKGKQNVTIVGDGPSSEILVAYNCTTGATVASNAFVLFGIEDSQKVSISNFNVDFQAIGWSAAQVSGDDTDTKVFAVIHVNSVATASEDITIKNLGLRVNHPWGSYFGDAYAAGKFSSKMMAMWITGKYANPTNAGVPNYVVGAGGLVTSNVKIKNCRFEDQHYSAFFWMTENCEISDCTLENTGGSIPPIRALHLNNNLLVARNTLHIVPAYADGSGESAGIYISDNNDDYSPKNPTVKDNTIVVSTGAAAGGTTIGAIELVATTLGRVTGNRVYSDGAAVNMKGIYVHHRNTWTTLGAAGESQLCFINDNNVGGMSVGIEGVTTLSNTRGNMVFDCSAQGILIKPYRGTTIGENFITNSGYGISVQRGGTSATGTALLTSNTIQKCNIGFSPTYTTNTLDLMTKNIVTDCATGATNLKLDYYRVESDYYENNTANIDSLCTAISPATMSQTIGSGTLYGDASTGF